MSRKYLAKTHIVLSYGSELRVEIKSGQVWRLYHHDDNRYTLRRTNVQISIKPEMFQVVFKPLKGDES